MSFAILHAMTFASRDWKDVGRRRVRYLYYVSINIPTRPFVFLPVNAAPVPARLLLLPSPHAIDTDYISYEDERKLIQKDVGNSHSSPQHYKEKIYLQKRKKMKRKERNSPGLLAVYNRTGAIHTRELSVDCNT